MSILVLNSGSSSLKFAIFPEGQEDASVEGIAEQLNSDDAQVVIKRDGKKSETALSGADHKQALQFILEQLPETPRAVGHRIVHGGEHFTEPALVTSKVIDEIRATVPLAPLHNPGSLLGIETMVELYPDLPQVTVFDTAFHQTLPEFAYRYALPEKCYRDYSVRRYGFHGTSHSYVSKAAAAELGFDLENSRVLVAHLGNGASTCAVLNGKSVDTSMGLTPLEGLVMGTRSGDVDPSLHQYLATAAGMSLEEINNMLNKESGLLGLSQGASNDMRTLRGLASEGNQPAALAIEIFCYRLAKSLAALCVATGGLDYLVFTGGIGENDPAIRERVTEKLAFLGLEIDADANANHGENNHGIITTADSPATALTICTKEEFMIAQLTAQTISK